MSAVARRIAIIGAGIAGASCARTLQDHGHTVQVLDKSRGVGGRMSTRRLEWHDGNGQAHQLSFDHGAGGFEVRSAEFAAFVAQAQRAQLLQPWQPVLAHATAQNDLWVAVPDMPALCRALLAGVKVQTHCQIERLTRNRHGWQLESAGQIVASDLDAVIIAIPPPQAATLLQPIRPDWAEQATQLPLLPDWTLMGLSSTRSAQTDAWQLAHPADGILASVSRGCSKPGRTEPAGMTQWVVHASAEWSARHIETPAAEVQAQLQHALARWLGQPPEWHYLTVHRWRYAVGPAGAQPVAGHCWWDAHLGLGVCGDAWAGRGVEAAWHSAQALAAAVSKDTATLAAARHNDRADI